MEIYFQKDESNFCYKLGRCKNFWVDKVGSNSDCGCCKIHKNKPLHLFTALKTFTGEKFNVLNPNNIKDNRKFQVDKYESKERCFCSQTIKNLRYAIHKPTQRVILIGSECIQRFQGEEKRKIADGKTCKFCNKSIDKRKKICKDGVCVSCFVSQPDYNYVLNFGKHRLYTVRQVYRRDKPYFEYLYKTCLEIEKYNKRITEELAHHIFFLKQ